MFHLIYLILEIENYFQTVIVALAPSREFNKTQLYLGSQIELCGWVPINTETVN